MAETSRGIRSICPNLCSSRYTQSRVPRSMSRQVLNISMEEISHLHIGEVFQSLSNLCNPLLYSFQYVPISLVLRSLWLSKVLQMCTQQSWVEGKDHLSTCLWCLASCSQECCWPPKQQGHVADSCLSWYPPGLLSHFLQSCFPDEWALDHEFSIHCPFK